MFLHTYTLLKFPRKTSNLLLQYFLNFIDFSDAKNLYHTNFYNFNVSFINSTTFYIFSTPLTY